MTTNEGKDEFYPKIERAYLSHGYSFYCENKIRGKGRSHLSKPDYVATKHGVIVIGEIKSPKEVPTSSSWRQAQNSDTDGFKVVRAEVAQREKLKAVTKEVGGHEIILRGQIPDYIRKIGRTYELPENVANNVEIKGGYSFPTREVENVRNAFKNIAIMPYEEMDSMNGVTTIIFQLKGIEDKGK
jgi:hypothetical protein